MTDMTVTTPGLTREQLEHALEALTWTRRQWADAYKLDPETIDQYLVRHADDFPVPLHPAGKLRTRLYWREDCREFMEARKLGPYRPKAVPTEQVRRFGTDRTCQECGVQLSTYNPGPNCYDHTPRTIPL